MKVNVDKLRSTLSITDMPQIYRIQIILFWVRRR